MAKTFRKKILTAEAILFDMDGVITDTMPYHFDAWKKVFDELGFALTCYDVYEREGQAGLESLREIFKKYRMPFRLSEARRILAKKERLFKMIVKPRFVKGALGFVSSMKKRGFKLALVTGTSRHEAKRILPKKVFSLFDAVVTGDEVKKGKPHPEPYLKSLSKLGVKSGAAVVLENAPLGIQSAKRAGLFCIALETSLPRKYLRDADVIIKFYSELRRVVRFSLPKQQ